MAHVRFNIFADFLRTLLASLIVGLIWSGAAMLVVLYLAHQASAEDMALEKIDKLDDANESRLILKTNVDGIGDHIEVFWGLFLNLHFFTLAKSLM